MTVGVVLEPVRAAEQAAVTDKEVAKYLEQAKQLAGKKQWDGAFAALQKAKQVPDKSAYAQYKIDEFIGYVQTQQRKYGEAAATFEQLAGSEQAPASDRARHLRTAAQLYLQAKHYSKAAQAADQALQASRGDAELLALSGQAKYLARDFRGAAQTMQQLVAVTEKKGAKPEEGWLQVLLNAHYELKNEQQIAQTWEKLLRHYPKPKYWQNVLQRRTAQDHPERIELYYYVLMFDLGLLNDPDDYEALALNALDVGAPSEAVRVLQAGFDNGTLAGKDEARFKRMLNRAQAEMAKSAATMQQLASQAQRATSGQPSVTLGRAYLAQRAYDEAIAP